MIPGYPGSFLAKAFANKTCSDNIEQLIQLGREEWVDKLIPKYTVGCKRGAFSPNYYKVLSDYNVNVIRAPIRSINNNTIVSEDGEEVQADILVLATGFKTHDGMLGDIKSTVFIAFSCCIVELILYSPWKGRSIVDRDLGTD